MSLVELSLVCMNLWLGLALDVSAAEKKILEPSLVFQTMKGDITIETLGGERKRYALGVPVATSLRFATGADAELTMVFNGSTEISMIGAGQLRILWPEEASQVIVLELEEGILRWRVPEGGFRHLRVASLLYEETEPLPGDRYLQWQPDSGIVEMGSLGGNLVFRPINHREGVSLKVGERVQFVATKENGEIVYDKLLHGKTVPRGKIVGPDPMTDAEKEKITRAQKKVEIAARAEIVAAKKRKIENDPSWICKNPPGKFKDCQWACEGNPKKERKTCRLDLPQVRCLRYRCNAEGQWRDPLPVIKDEALLRCRISPQVAKCQD